VLVMPIMEKLFLIYYDASGQGLGSTVMHHVVVYAYASRDNNYPTHDLELATMVHAVKI
jgi:hypothetical protein